VEAGWAGRRPRPSGEGDQRLDLGEEGSPREVEGGAGRSKAMAHLAGPKIGDGPKVKKNFF
jgi:hypothetical protein